MVAATPLTATGAPSYNGPWNWENPPPAGAPRSRPVAMKRTAGVPDVRTIPAPGRLPLAVALLLLAAGCGREAPEVAPAALTVTSTPPGATILLDGADTGLVTPHTFDALAADLYTVSVRLDGWVPDPVGETVDLQPLDRRTVAFTFSQTGLAVSSTPPGARILIDGEETGLVTPATVGGLDAGPAEVALALTNHVVFPAATVIQVTAGEVTALPPDAFVLRPRRTVVLEGFANVDCGPCPQLTDNLLALTAEAGHGPDYAIFLEFAVSWPNLQDPFYQANPAENSDRYTFYRVLGAPTLVADGTVLDDALDPGLLRATVVDHLDADPGVLVDVTADPSQATVPVTVTLTPLRAVDLTGHVLYVALYEDEVTITPAPGSNRQTEFHHVFRDRVDDPPALGPLAGGVPERHELNLQRGDRDPAGVVVVAFIQDPATGTVLQAGSTLATARLPAPEGIAP